MDTCDHDDSCSDDCCAHEGCGCHSAEFTPTEVHHCPACDKRLLVIGHPKAILYRLACAGCGYLSDILSRDEVHDIL
ncbi:hypothetical protein ACFLVR_01350 [Chloroflexota bacterium]